MGAGTGEEVREAKFDQREAGAGYGGEFVREGSVGCAEGDGGEGEGDGEEGGVRD